MYLRPRTRFNEYAVIPGYSALDLESVSPRYKAGIITRLRIWVRKIHRKTRNWYYWDHYGGFGRNVVGRSGWEVTAGMRRPTSFGTPIVPAGLRQGNSQGSGIRGDEFLGFAGVWTKNQRARLF